MNRHKLIVLSIVLVGMFQASCSKERETPKGKKFQVIERGDGDVVEPGQILVLDICIKDSKDSAWFDNRKYNTPDLVMMRDTSAMRQEFGIMEVFRMLSAGDSVALTEPAFEVFENAFRQDVPPSVDRNSKFTFFVGVRDIVDSAGAMAISEEIRAREEQRMAVESEKYRAEAEKLSAAQFEKDAAIIENFLRSKKINARATASGLRYVIKRKGRGDMGHPGQTAEMKYSGYLLNGKVFDSGVYTFPIGQGQVIQGWDEIATLMNKGTKLTVYIPSPLGYGPSRQSQDIVENSILVFDMELLDLKDIN